MSLKNRSQETTESGKGVGRGWESHQTMMWIRPKWSREGRRVKNILDCCAILRSVWQGHWRVIKLKSLITGVPFPFCIQSLLEAALDLNKLWKILLVKFLEFVKTLPKPTDGWENDTSTLHIQFKYYSGPGRGGGKFTFCILFFDSRIESSPGQFSQWLERLSKD